MEFSEWPESAENELETMERITRHALAIAISMIQEKGEGHVGATTSAMHLMAAIYFHRHLQRLSGQQTLCLQVESHKPHAIPGWHALLYLEGVLTREQMRQFRTFGGPNAYPTHLEPGIQIPTGSLGLGPAAATGLAFLDQYLRDQNGGDTAALQISIIGDSEFDEGIISELIKERATHQIGGWVDVIDYNRQSLDGNLDEDLVSRLSETYQANGHRVFILKYGSILRSLFAQAGGTRLRSRIDSLSTSDYHALLRLDGAQVRQILCLSDQAFERHLNAPHGDSTALKDVLKTAVADRQMKALLNPLSDSDLKAALANLGGHDLPMLLAALSEAQRINGGVAIIAYTVKGWGLPSIAGSLSGHWQRPTKKELNDLQVSSAANPGDVWERPLPESPEGRLLQAVSNTRAATNPGHTDRAPGTFDEEYPGPEVMIEESVSTQTMTGRQFSWLSSLEARHPLRPLTKKILTLSADVAFSAGLKDWINRCGVWGPPSSVQTSARYEESPEMNTERSSKGQHIRLSNVEQFLGVLTASFGKCKDFSQEEVFPFAFFYDIFLERFVEMFKYAAFWDARCWFVGTISGLTAPSESGLHHSLLSGIVGHCTPNVVTWEPCFPQEVSWIFADEFQRAVTGNDQGRRVRYFRMGSRAIPGSLLSILLRECHPGLPENEAREAARLGCLSGGFRVVDATLKPEAQIGKNVVTLAATGALVMEAIDAAAELAARGIFANVIAISSAGLLEKNSAGDMFDMAFPQKERNAAVPIVTITDSHPSCLSGLIQKLAVKGRPPAHAPLGVTRYDRSGTLEQLLTLHGLDPTSIANAAESLLAHQ